MSHHFSSDFNQKLKKHLSKIEVIEKLKLDINTIHLSPGLLKADLLPPDVTYKSFVADSRGCHSAFLLFSNPNGKMQVAHNVQKASEARSVLGNRLNWVIEPPIITGFFDGISWALFHMNYPLSHGRIKWVVQRTLLAPAILKWIAGSLEKSCQKLPAPKIAAFYNEPVKQMVNDDDFSPDIRKCASDTLDSLESGRWHPLFCLSHNDLWKGNIMVPSGSKNTDKGKFYFSKFRVIDWAGSAVEGIPFFDLMKFCQSFQVQRYYTRKAILTHCRILDCSIKEARFYLIAALALLGKNLDQFPRSAYIHLSHSLFHYMSTFV
ncbi:hypothetical protein [Desulfobacter vibrioformis]|uniref:hypothetical protein n=1 Tax=Desulfobacter vibrioformis TaxID=34031 RepID=UPI000557C286|nr:hypothetical protein [Desulfobacter vibrioformis]